MSTIDIDRDCLAEILPILTSVCKIVGSADSPSEHIVRLRIAGDNVPPGHVSCEVTKVIGTEVAQLTIRFKADDRFAR